MGSLRRDLLDGPVRENFDDAVVERLPLIQRTEEILIGFVAVKIVDHQEAAAQQVLAQLLGLVVGEHPVADLDRVQRGPVINVVGAVQIHHLFRRSRVDAGQAPNAFKQMTVGAGEIHGPLAGPGAVGAELDARMIGISVNIGIPQPRANPFGGALVILGQRHPRVAIFVFDGRVGFKRPLRSQNAENREESQASNSERGTEAHPSSVSG